MKHGVRPCQIMQHKPYIVELSLMETQKSHDSRTITDHGGTTPDQCGICTNVTFRTEFRSDFELYTPCHPGYLGTPTSTCIVLCSDSNF